MLFGRYYMCYGDGWAPVGPAVLKTVAGRAKRLGCVRLTYVTAIHDRDGSARALFGARHLSRFSNLPRFPHKGVRL